MERRPSQEQGKAPMSSACRNYHDYRIACDIRCELGEGPLWSPRGNVLYWVDILRAKLYRLSLGDDSVDAWNMPEMTGWNRLRETA